MRFGAIYGGGAGVGRVLDAGVVISVPVVVSASCMTRCWLVRLDDVPEDAG